MAHPLTGCGLRPGWRDSGSGAECRVAETRAELGTADRPEVGWLCSLLWSCWTVGVGRCTADFCWAASAISGPLRLLLPGCWPIWIDCEWKRLPVRARALQASVEFGDVVPCDRKLLPLLSFVEAAAVGHVDGGRGPADGSAAIDVVLRAVERFARDVGRWLKVAGGQKAALLDEVVLAAPLGIPSTLLLELGAFVGYTAVRLGHGSGAGVRSIEVDMVAVCVARRLINLSRLASSVEVLAGCARHTLPRVVEEQGGASLALAFLDTCGSRFHEDASQLERMAVPAPSLSVVADNVLKPGAPLFAWMGTFGWSSVAGTASASFWAVPEFLQSDTEDWMAACRPCSLPCGWSPLRFCC